MRLALQRQVFPPKKFLEDEPPWRWRVSNRSEKTFDQEVIFEE